MFKIFTMFSKRDFALIALSVGLTVLGVWADLQIPTYMRDIVLVATGEVYGTSADVWRTGGIMMGFAGLGFLVATIVGFIGAIVSSSHSRILRERLFKKVGDFSSAEMQSFSVPSLITRSTNDIVQVRVFTAMAIGILIRSPITAIWAITRTVNTSFELSLVPIATIAITAVVLVVLTSIALPRFRRIQKLTDRLNENSRENITGIRVVRAYNAAEFEQGKFTETNTSIKKNAYIAAGALAIFWPYIGIMLAGLSLALYWVGSWIITSGRTDDPGAFFADMMVFIQYSGMIVSGFLMMIFVLTMLPRALVSGRRVHEVISTTPTITDRVAQSDGGFSHSSNNGDIRFENVSLQYKGAESKILCGIDLTIKKNSTVAFIGNTGSGKSTLISLLPRINDATEGKITIGGTDIKDFSQFDLHNIVGYVPQTAVIFGGTIKSNIDLGETEKDQKDLTDEEIWNAIDLAQAKEFVSKLDDGLDHKVAQGGTNLSGGQKQRLGIARVLARKPKVIIFDDTFSALDYKTDMKLRTAIRKNLKDTTVIIVAQRIGTIRDADQIFVLENNRIVASGKHTDLMKTSTVYKSIAASQGVTK
ncbi:MAG: ABC transporter ATP-binding protein/permease [Firmicutes bacterium]|nr:ABC transporter ATP-binding protein/permease [Bacillota bacterium]